MDYEYFTYRSVTAAMKASRVLLDAGLAAALARDLAIGIRRRTL